MAAFVVAAALAAVILLWSLFRRVLDAPRYFAKLNRDRRRDVGVAALSDGFIALQAGDPTAPACWPAKRAAICRATTPRSCWKPRSDLALGDMQSAREHYRALISNRRLPSPRSPASMSRRAPRAAPMPR